MILSPAWSARPLQVLEALNARLESANSYYENVASHLWDAARAGHPSLGSPLLSLFRETPSLERLMGFARDTGLDRRYLLAPDDGDRKGLDGLDLPRRVQSSLRRFLKTVEEKQKSPDPALRSLEYAFGSDRCLEGFLSGLSDLRWCGPAQKILLEAPGGPLPFLKLNRLLHLLLRRGFEYKMSELADWAGGIDTAFLTSPRCRAAIRFCEAFWENHSLPPMIRSARWSERWRKTATAGALFEPARLLALLEPENDPYARSLKARLRAGSLAIRRMSLEEMEMKQKEPGRRQMPPGVVEAVFDMPREPADRATFYLLDPRENDPFRPPHRVALSVVANALHESIHLDQFEADPETDLIEAEFEANLIDLWFRLKHGDEEFHRFVSSLSPFGLLMGLRNFVERAVEPDG